MIHLNIAANKIVKLTLSYVKNQTVYVRHITLIAIISQELINFIKKLMIKLFITLRILPNKFNNVLIEYKIKYQTCIISSNNIYQLLD